MFKGLIDQIRLSWRLLRDPRIPLWAKAIPFAAAAYILSPIDLLPDFIPFIGQIDDITLLILSLQLVERVSPQDIVSEHRRDMKGSPTVIRGQSERVER